MSFTLKTIFIFIFSSIVCSQAAFAENSKEIFTVAANSTHEETDYAIHQIWQINVDDNTDIDIPRSLAYNQLMNHVLLAAPGISYDNNYIIRRYSGNKGEQLENVAIKLSSEQQQALLSLYNESDYPDLRYFYLLNDSQGNIVIVFDLMYEGKSISSSTPYPIVFGVVKPTDYSVNELKIVYVESLVSSSSNKWHQLGHPAIYGDILSDDYYAVFPLSSANNKNSLTQNSVVVTPEITSNGKTKYAGLNYYELDGEQVSIAHCARSYFTPINDKYILMDNFGYTPIIFPFNNLAANTSLWGSFKLDSSTANGISPHSKGVATWITNGQRFLIIGNDDGEDSTYGNSPKFDLCSWDADLNSTVSWDINYFKQLTHHLSIYPLQMNSSHPRAAYYDDDETASESQFWRLTNVVNCPHDDDTHDIHLYTPGNVLTAYHFGPDNNFTTDVDSPITTESQNITTYYTINGILLENKPSAAGVYIKRHGNITSKLIIK